MSNKTTLTRKMSVTVDEAVNIYYMAKLIKTALLAPPPEIAKVANDLQKKVLALYPELKSQLEE